MQQDLALAASDRPIVVLYHRLSREEQVEGQGLERQRAGSGAWCTRHGLVADVCLEDLGYSAFTADNIRRGQLGRLLERIATGAVCGGSTIVMENLDRFSRQDAFEALQLFTSILVKDITIVTTCDGYCYTRSGSAMERMMAVVMSAMHFGRGNSESETKVFRVGQAWEKKRRLARESKKPHGKRCPAWIRLTSKGEYELIDKKADELRWMCDRAIAGWGRRKIVKDLIVRKVDPWQRASPKRPKPVWNESYVQKILTSGEACGIYRPSRSPKHGSKTFEEVIEGYYPAAVDRQTFERARAAMAARRGGGGRKGEFKNLLQNLCQCAYCHRGMTIEHKGSRSSGPKLVCQRALMGDCVHEFRHDYRLVEAAVVFGIGDYANELVRASASKSDEIRGLLAVKEACRVDVADRIKRLVGRMEKQDDEALDDALRERRAEARGLDAEVSLLRQELLAAREIAGPTSPYSIMAFYERLKAVPASELPSARNAINQGLRSIVKRIAFRDGELEVGFVDGGTAWADIRAGRSSRSNPGQFTSTMHDGRQLRRGERTSI